MTKRFLAGLAVVAALWALAPFSAAQAQNETVTVTAPTTPPEKLNVTIDRFIKNFAKPATSITGKIARWTEGVCASAAGLTDEQNKYIAEHVMQVAAQVGAPTETRIPCRANIQILFAQKPQELLDEIRIHHKVLIGYNDGPSQAKKMATMNAPVQAYYATQTRDFWGNIIPDDNRDCPVCYYVTSGSRISDGITSEFTNVLVVVDLTKAKGYGVAGMADYVAMLALAQTNAFNACRELPSVTNMLLPDCAPDNKATALTEADIGYLKGLYRMDPATKGNLARGDIAGQMQKALTGK